MSNNFTFRTAGGRIVCQQCKGTSRRTKDRCKAPAAKGRSWCKHHGGSATGPRTAQGKERCAQAKLIHGRETRTIRAERAKAIGRIRALEDLGFAIGILRGLRTRGPKPSRA